MYAVYALIDPRDNTVFYIGVTEDVYQRFLDHINCSGTNFAKNARIVALRAANKMVVMETLEEVEDRFLAYERETYWIHHFDMMKEPIVNVSQRSSIRKAKKTNLRLGRKISQEIATYVQTVTQPKTVTPPEIRNEIIRLHAKGFKRTEIRDAMKLSGAQFWMIKQVLDEYQQTGKEAL